MTYRVIFSDQALAQAKRYLLRIAEEQELPLIAERWWNKALAAIDDLEQFPNANPIAPENENSRYTIREKIVDQCLFLFRVEEDHRVVRILRFRHGSQLPFDDVE